MLLKERLRFDCFYAVGKVRHKVFRKIIAHDAGVYKGFPCQKAVNHRRARLLQQNWRTES